MGVGGDVREREGAVEVGCGGVGEGGQQGWGAEVGEQRLQFGDGKGDVVWGFKVVHIDLRDGEGVGEVCGVGAEEEEQGGVVRDVQQRHGGRSGGGWRRRGDGCRRRWGCEELVDG